MSTQKLFLDLEETIIDNWHSAKLINVDAIRGWIDRMSETDHVELRIFSFAIWNKEHKAEFEQNIKAGIENALDVEIVEWLSTEEMQAIVEEWNGVKYFDRTDFISMNGKHGVFEKVCLARETNCECTLVDDVVPDRRVIDFTRDLIINLTPVQNLLDQPLQRVQHRM